MQGNETVTSSTVVARKKNLGYELLRICAVIGVVYNHTSYRGFVLYELEDCSLINSILSIFLGIFCRMAVPLFLMVSGALLLKRKDSIKTVLKKRVLRIFIVLVLFTLFNYLFLIWYGSIPEPSVYDFFVRLWHDGITIPYWYLYAYLGLMLMLPLLQPMVQGASNHVFRYLILLHLGYNLLNIIGWAFSLGSLDSDLLLPLAERTIFFFLIGYYVSERDDFKKLFGRFKWQFLAASLIAIFVTGILTMYDVSVNEDGYYFFMDSLQCIPVLFLFVLVSESDRIKRLNGIPAALIGGLGSCTFGVYLLEGIYRRLFDSFYEMLEPRIHVLPACFCWVGVVCVFSFLTAYILKKIPGLKRLL